MGINTSKIPRDVSTTWLNGRVPKHIADPDAYKAAKGFEAYFARQLVREMMKSTDIIGGKGMGGEVFQDMFKDLLGDQIAESGGLGITEMIYRQVMANKGQKPFLEEGEKQVDKLDLLAEAVPRRMAKYGRIVEQAAERVSIEPELIFAVMQQESGGNSRAVSHAGAKGLMQLIDTTAAEMGVDDVFDPVQNIHGGAGYLRKQFDAFGGDMDKALAAYNAGPGAVRRHGGIPPYRETTDYVKRVKAIYYRLKDQVAQQLERAPGTQVAGTSEGPEIADIKATNSEG